MFDEHVFFFFFRVPEYFEEDRAWSDGMLMMAFGVGSTTCEDLCRFGRVVL